VAPEGRDEERLVGRIAYEREGSKRSAGGRGIVVAGGPRAVVRERLAERKASHRVAIDLGG
jgi:orotidine-5'-phosphate decarboxylase